MSLINYNPRLFLGMDFTMEQQTTHVAASRMSVQLFVLCRSFVGWFVSLRSAKLNSPRYPQPSRAPRTAPTLRPL